MLISILHCFHSSLLLQWFAQQRQIHLQHSYDMYTRMIIDNEEDIQRLVCSKCMEISSYNSPILLNFVIKSIEEKLVSTTEMHIYIYAI
jgi:Fe2+ or Zn2+ uptake regulation protein